ALALIAVLALRSPDLNPATVERYVVDDIPQSELSKSETIRRVEEEGKGVLDSDSPRAKLDLWYRQARPLLHQAAHYSVPIYYLDSNLRIVDWNVAFETVCGKLLEEDIQGRHVNWFIAHLLNHDQVFDHAKQFTQDVQEKGAFPYVDSEPLEYDA